jgi:hypothetical protein
MLSGASELRRVARDGFLPLSFLEEAQLRLEATKPHWPFNTRLCLDLIGLLDVWRLKRALNGLIQRHEVLRTTFEPQHDRLRRRDLRFERRIHASTSAEISMIDMQEAGTHTMQRRIADDIAVREYNREFDYRAAPLLRAVLLQFDEERYRLILVVPHLISDWQSMLILRDDLRSLYLETLVGSSAGAAGPQWQYVDFAAWQRRRLGGHVLKREAAYWLAQGKEWKTAEVTIDQLGAEQSVNSGGQNRCARIQHELSEALVNGVRHAARHRRVSVYSVMLACFGILLQRHTGARRMAVWCNFANRRRREFARTVGWFAHSRLLGIDLRDDPTFAQLVGQVYLTVLEALKNAEVPGHLIEAVAQMVHEKHAGGVIAGDGYVSFELISDRGKVYLKPECGSGLLFHSVDLPPGSRRPALAVTVKETGDRLTVMWDYPGNAFDAAGIERMSNAFQEVLQASIINGDRRISELTPAAL